jgi:CDK inhibitor PHO81
MLKEQLIKQLSATPPILAQNASAATDPQALLQANKATFFFRVVSNTAHLFFSFWLITFQERELEKVNAFYLQKEAEVCQVVDVSNSTYPLVA